MIFTNFGNVGDFYVLEGTEPTPETTKTRKVFSNFYKWLKPNGKVCVHMVRKEKFDPVLEKFSGLIPLFNPQKHSKKRQTQSELTFKKFKYKTDWDFNQRKTVFREHFEFKDGRTREHKHKLYIEPLQKMINIAKQNGFAYENKIDLTNVNHEYEYICIFTKIS